MKNEVANQVLSELEAREEPVMTTFPAEFVSKRSGGISRTLKSENEKSFGLRSGEPCDINFAEPAFVATVEINFSRPAVGAGIELLAYDALAARQVRNQWSENAITSQLRFHTNCVCSGVSLLLPPGFFELFSKRTLQIESIRILGFLAQDFEQLSKDLTELQELRGGAIAEISKARTALQGRQEALQQREDAVSQLEATTKQELAALEEEIDETKEKAQQADLRLKALLNEVAKSDAQNQSLAEQIKLKEETGRSIDSELAKGRAHQQALASDISVAERKLRALTTNVNLFSEEFSSFSDHGAKQARTFLWLCVVPLVVIVLLTGQLLFGAVDLSVKYVKEPHIDLLTVFVTRLPYLTVCVSILAVCHGVLRFLLHRVSTIYAERLDFAKIGIVAKDVSSAAAIGLSIQDKELYEARTYLKIEMLKSYLSGNIGTFAYRQRKQETAQPAVTDNDEAEAQGSMQLEASDTQVAPNPKPGK
ncbi:Chromosome partition protein Smc (plasmid) [Cupriavidus sp. H19C3]|uniref:hypothetical protein n=1 Tax=Cupriavidus sp. H19C3 TaxID=3241603 RepID=UPI003BF8D2E3